MVKLIETHGGEFLQSSRLASHPERDHVIKLKSSRHVPIPSNMEQDLFDIQFIKDCVEQKTLLDLNHYLAASKSLFENYDANSIMNGDVGWTDLNRLEEGEKVSDIEDEDDLREKIQSKKKPMKANRMLYSKNEQKEILDWIVENEAFASLKGNEIWKRMEAENVGRGRSWQSLREHFRKTIIKQIHLFGFNDETQDNFKVAMGVKQDSVVSARIKSMGGKGWGGSGMKKTASKTETEKEAVCCICGPKVEGVRPTYPGYVCEKCSRPSTSVFSSQSAENDSDDSNSLSGNDALVDKLLDESDIPEAELSDEITKDTIEEDEMPSFPKRTKRRLYQPRFHDTPRTVPRPAEKRKRREEIEDLPSSQDFAVGLESVSLQGPATCLTSTQNLSLDSEAETEAEVLPQVLGSEVKENDPDEEEEEIEMTVETPRQSKRLKLKEKIDWSHMKLTSSIKGKSSKGSGQEESYENQEDDEEYRPKKSKEGGESPKKKKSSPLPKKNDVKSPARKSPIKLKKLKKKLKIKSTKKSNSETATVNDVLENSKLENDKIINRTNNSTNEDDAAPSQSHKSLDPDPSEDLLERHLQDQMNLHNSQVNTESLVDELNNIGVESGPEPGAAGADPMTPTKFRLRHAMFETRDDKWETESVKSGRFFNHGEFSGNFRQPYSCTEERAMVSFFLEQGGYQLRKGRAIWMKMEIMKVCEGRTWQSMKGRWEKYISRDLKKFDVTHEDLVEADRRIFGEDGGPKEEADNAVVENANFRGVRSGRKFYSKEEDLKIVNYLLENRRYQEVNGRALWQVIVVGVHRILIDQFIFLVDGGEECG